MKKVLILCFALVLSACNGQKKKLQKLVDEQIAEVEDMIDLSTIKLSFDPISEDDIMNTRDAFTQKRKEISHSYFDSLSVVVFNEYPNSFFYIEFDEHDFRGTFDLRAFYFNDHPNRYPTFKVKKVIYADGSTAKAENSILTDEMAKNLQMNTMGSEYTMEDFVESGYFFQKNSKPIIGVEALVITHFPKYTDYIVNKEDKSIETELGKIEIINFKNNEFTFKFPTPLVDQIEIAAQHHSGNYLTRRGSQKFHSDIQIENLQKLIKTLEDTKEKISKGEIKSEEELKEFLQAQSLEKFLEPEPYTTLSYYFSGDIDKIIFSTIKENTNEESVHTYYIPQYRIDRIKESKYVLGVDNKTQKMGVLDLDGNWIVEPIYYELHQTNYKKNYLQGALNEDDDLDTDYWLDRENKRLRKPDYFSKGISFLVGNQYFDIVGAEKSEHYKNLGVENDEGKLIVPLKYNQIDRKGDKILGIYGSGIDIYDTKGNLVKKELSNDELKMMPAQKSH